MRRKKKNSRKSYRRKLQIRLFVLTVIFIGLITTLLFIKMRPKEGKEIDGISPEQSEMIESNEVNVVIKERIIQSEVIEKEAFDLPELFSSAAILIQVEDGTIIAQLAIKDMIYPASLTKIMTCILAIEKIEDLNQTVELPADNFEMLYERGASLAGFEPNESVRISDLLYGSILPSGGECCIGLAITVAGSEEEFVNLMNQKAEELELKGTHFSNTTGLHDSQHYSTVEDIAVLLRYALQNEVFREIFTSSRHSSAATNIHPEGLTFYSSMFKLMDSAEIIGGTISGGKTGYTQEAGLCLASMAEVWNQEYILVTIGAQSTFTEESLHIMDAFSVYNKIGEELKDDVTYNE